MASNTCPVTSMDGTAETIRLNPSLPDPEQLYAGILITNWKTDCSSSRTSSSMNSDKQRQRPVSERTGKKEETLCWQRKSTNRPRARALSGDDSKASQFSSPSTPNNGVIKVVSRRKKSTSINRKIANKKKNSSKKVPREISSHDSDVSLGDFSTHDEFFWQRKETEIPQKNHADDPLSASVGSTCNLNDLEDGHSARSSYGNPNATNNNSISSRSMNSESNGSLASSASSDKPPLPKTPRRTHAARTVELRKQMRELHRMEHHATSPAAHKFAPRIAMVATSAAGETTAKRPPTKSSSQSQILVGRGTSPIKRTRSLQRKQSLERDLERAPLQAVDTTTDDSPHIHSKPIKQLSNRGPSMRNILRNRRKLECELNRNDVFHYVLHKGSRDNLDPQHPGSARTMDTSSTNHSSTSHSPVAHYNFGRPGQGVTSLVSSASSTSTGNMPLEHFLKMKQQSEMLVQIQQHHNKTLKPNPQTPNRKGLPLSRQVPQPVEETWHESHSLDNFLSNHESSSDDLRMHDRHPFGRIRPVLGQSLFQLNQQNQAEQQQQDDSIIDDECFNISMASNLNPINDDGEEHHDFLDSFISSDWKDLPSAWKNDMKEDVDDEDKSSPAIHERKRSQSLNLLKDDTRMLMDDDRAVGDDIMSLQNSMGDLSLLLDASTAAGGVIEKEVKEVAITDPSSGRRGVYSGPISTLTGMPNGVGRLEYLDSGEVFLGRFLHGWWSGHGTCINSQTKETYTGYFLDSVKHGTGTTKFADGRLFEGTYQKGEIMEGKMTYQDGSIFVGTFENEARNGRGTYTFPNGVFFSGKFRNDHFLSGALLYPNGSRFVGHWKNGVRHGPGKEIRPDGSVIRDGMWREGCFDFVASLET